MTNTGQFSHSSSAAARLDEERKSDGGRALLSSVAAACFSLLRERVNVCWYLCKRKDDPELLSATFTAAGVSPDVR